MKTKPAGSRSRSLVMAGMLSTLFTTSAWAQSSPHSISNVYVFGDSLSDGGAGVGLMDIGCRSAYVGPLVCGRQRDSVKLSTPFHDGRSISDGPVATEVMARLLGRPLRPAFHNKLLSADKRGENYAISGAQAGARGFNVMFGLRGQLDSYAAQYAKADPSALYVVFMGGNDVLDAIKARDPSRITSAVQHIQAGLDQLATLGARNVLVYQLPDLGDAPRFANGPTADRRIASDYTALFNAGVEALRMSAGSTLHRFDTPAFWKFLKQTAFERNVDYKRACLESVADILNAVKSSPDRNVSIKGKFLPSCPSVDRLDRRLFFDDLHPSGYYHQMLGHASYDFVIERMTGRCGLHAWAQDAGGERGWTNVRRGLVGSIYGYDNPYNGQREYLRLANTGGDSAYWYFPIDRKDNTYWQYLGTQAPTSCGTDFRASMNFWDARLPSGGVATGDFAPAKRGDRFLYANPYLNKIEYFRFRDPYGTGAFWYFPIDGVTTSDFWWERIQVR